MSHFSPEDEVPSLYFNFHRFTTEDKVPKVKKEDVSGLRVDASDNLHVALNRVTEIREFPRLVFVEPSSPQAAERFTVATLEDLDLVSSTDYGTIQRGDKRVGIWKRKDGAIMIGPGRALEHVENVVVAKGCHTVLNNQFISKVQFIKSTARMGLYYDIAKIEHEESAAHAAAKSASRIITLNVALDPARAAASRNNPTTNTNSTTDNPETSSPPFLPFAPSFPLEPRSNHRFHGLMFTEDGTGNVKVGAGLLKHVWAFPLVVQILPSSDPQWDICPVRYEQLQEASDHSESLLFHAMQDMKVGDENVYGWWLQDGELWEGVGRVVAVFERVQLFWVEDLDPADDDGEGASATWDADYASEPEEGEVEDDEDDDEEEEDEGDTEVRDQDITDVRSAMERFVPRVHADRIALVAQFAQTRARRERITRGSAQSR
ncbi:hypothetical protein BDV06DRAFT_220327 [Aspergillus oleicola]